MRQQWNEKKLEVTTIMLLLELDQPVASLPRLAENSSVRVLLLEAGGSDGRLSIKMPSAFYMPLNDKRINWGFFSEPESGLNNRRIHCPRGKVLGGSSSINGMVYIRGNKEDFNSWEALERRVGTTKTFCPILRNLKELTRGPSLTPIKGMRDHYRRQREKC